MTEQAPPRVVLVDDHAMFRAGVRAEVGAALDIVGEAATVAEAIAVIRHTTPDVVLLDVHLPDGGGRGRDAQDAALATLAVWDDHLASTGSELLAARIELVEGRWCCTALEFG